MQAPVTPPAGPVLIRGGLSRTPWETGGVLACAADWVGVGKVEGEAAGLFFRSSLLACFGVALVLFRPLPPLSITTK